LGSGASSQHFLIGVSESAGINRLGTENERRSVWKTRPKKPRPSRDVVAVAGSEEAGVFSAR
jgi:hypothetical protein